MEEGRDFTGHTDLEDAVFYEQMLDGSIFSDTNCSGAIFTESSLEGAQFVGTELEVAHFEMADLTDSKFRGADLREAYFRNAGLVRADLRGADLREADLSYADLSGANLEGADFEGANLYKTILISTNYERANNIDTTDAILDEDGLNAYNASVHIGRDFRGMDYSNRDLSFQQMPHALLQHAILNGTSFERSSVVLGDFTGAQMVNTFCENANFTLATFLYTNLDRANLHAALLTRTIFTYATLTGANLDFAVLIEASLAEANLSGASIDRGVLASANLTGANLQRAGLRLANFKGAILQGADLREANLNRAFLNQTDLTGADLTGANLSRANLTGADLTGANLSRANLTGANLTGTTLRGAIITDTIGLNARDRERARERVAAAPPVDVPLIRAGVAFQVHNLNEKFSQIRNRYLSAIIEKTGPDVPTISLAQLGVTLGGIIDASDLPDPDKATKKSQLATIIQSMGLRRPNSDQQEVVNYTIAYVLTLPASAQLYYATTFIHDCANAYDGSNGLSCIAGSYERIHLIINDVLTMLQSLEDTSCDATCAKILGLFTRKFSYNSAIGGWKANIGSSGLPPEIIAKHIEVDEGRATSYEFEPSELEAQYNNFLEYAIREYKTIHQIDVVPQSVMDELRGKKDEFKNMLRDTLIGGKRRKIRKTKRKRKSNKSKKLNRKSRKHKRHKTHKKM